MTHKNYYQISAKDNYDLGIQKGLIFGKYARNALRERKKEKNWLKKVELAQTEFTLTKQYFPQYVAEIEGYATSSNISLSEFWTMSLEDDFDYIDEKCTTVVTNNGMLLSHNEDWEKESEDKICLLKKTIGELTTLEFFYINTLGGASVCINSYGYVMTINTMDAIDRQIGIPRNVIARWLSETKSIEDDLKKLKTLKRAYGYNHVFVNKKGKVWDLETTATQQKLSIPDLPYVHTNHYLTKELESYEDPGDPGSTITRYESACKLVKPQMTVNEMIQLTNNTSKGYDLSIFNERTIGRFVVDMKNQIAKVWLKREEKLGWVEYSLDFI